MASAQSAPAPSITASVAITVSPAGNVEHFAGLRGLMMDFLIGKERHALFAARHQQRFEAKFTAQLLRLGGEFSFGRPATDDFPQFRAIRRDHGRAGVPGVVVPLGIDQHRLVAGAGDGDHLGDVGQAALAIIREDDHIGLRHPLLEVGQLGLQDFVRRRRLEVDAQQLLLAADDAQLDRGVDVAVDMQSGIDLLLFEQAGERAARFVVADDREQAGEGAERRRVARDVGGAAQTFFHALDPDHGHRRFRRNPADLAEPVAVEHDVADHQQANVADHVEHVAQCSATG